LKRVLEGTRPSFSLRLDPPIPKDITPEEEGDREMEMKEEYTYEGPIEGMLEGVTMDIFR
jgi:hypothetical protein